MRNPAFLKAIKPTLEKPNRYNTDPAAYNTDLWGLFYAEMIQFFIKSIFEGSPKKNGENLHF